MRVEGRECRAMEEGIKGLEHTESSIKTTSGQRGPSEHAHDLMLLSVDPGDPTMHNCVMSATERLGRMGDLNKAETLSPQLYLVNEI